MSSAQPLLLSVPAHQEQLVQLDAGTELRCVSGSLRVRFGHAGMVHNLSAGQSVRLPDAQWVSFSTTGDIRAALRAEAPLAVQAEKNRQGLFGHWRSLAARLMVRRGPRAA